MKLYLFLLSHTLYGIPRYIIYDTYLVFLKFLVENHEPRRICIARTAYIVMFVSDLEASSLSIRTRMFRVENYPIPWQCLIFKWWSENCSNHLSPSYVNFWRRLRCAVHIAILDQCSLTEQRIRQWYFTFVRTVRPERVKNFNRLVNKIYIIIGLLYL